MAIKKEMRFTDFYQNLPILCHPCVTMTFFSVYSKNLLPYYGDSMALEYPSGSKVLLKRINPEIFIEYKDFDIPLSEIHGMYRVLMVLMAK